MSSPTLAAPTRARVQAAAIDLGLVTAPALPLVLFAIVLVSGSDAELARALGSALAVWVIGLCLVMYVLWQLVLVARARDSFGVERSRLKLVSRSGALPTRSQRARWAAPAPALVLLALISGYPGVIALWGVAWIAFNRSPAELLSGLTLATDSEGREPATDRSVSES